MTAASATLTVQPIEVDDIELGVLLHQEQYDMGGAER